MKTKSSVGTLQSRTTESPRKLPADWSEQYIANEFKVVALNERPIPYAKLHQCNDPKAAAEYWRLNIATNPNFNSASSCRCPISSR